MHFWKIRKASYYFIFDTEDRYFDINIKTDQMYTENDICN